MRFTLSWLKRHLDTDATLAQISETLTRIGLEVEEIIDNTKLYEPFIIAEILEAHQHPSADKLRVCKVYDGKHTLQIVCGAPNARAGIKVVLAPIGAVIPAGSFVIKAAKIRDVESHGMLCSAEELLLSEESEGIIELGKDAVVGAGYAAYSGLDDALIDISLTPNRGDAACVHGIARDLAAAGLGTLLESEHAIPSYSKYPIIIEDAANCQEFTATVIKGLDNTKSAHSYITKALRAIGSKPKTALVDISNFAMLDTGRPNHMYDLDKIKGTVTIRQSTENEAFVALGGQEYKLPAGLLVVSDEEKVLAIAGVMGGELSKVDEGTRNILVEVANFHPDMVAKAGRSLNILSDSRYRFERRIDPGSTDFFVDYLTKLILDTVGGALASHTKALGTSLAYPKSIEFSQEVVSRIAGCDIAPAFITQTLTALGFGIDGQTVHIPSYRQGDITISEDLVEEVLRIYGLDNIPAQPIPLSFENTKFRSPQFASHARQYLTSQGFDEMITYAFISHKQAMQFASQHHIELLNPISQEMSVMRASHLPMLLEHANRNMAYGMLDAAYFEVGNIFVGAEPDQQKLVISGLLTGKHMRKTSFKEERDVDFYDVKAAIFALIKLYGLDPSKCKISRGAPSYYHPGKSAVLSLGKTIIGYFGELNFAALELQSAASAFELLVANLPVLKTKAAKGKLDISYLQSVTRDFAFTLNDDVEIGSMLRAVQTDEIEAANVFDIYKGKGVEEGKKSVAFTITLRPKTETFTDSQIDMICQKVVNLVTQNYGGVQR